VRAVTENLLAGLARWPGAGPPWRSARAPLTILVSLAPVPEILRGTGSAFASARENPAQV